MSESHKLIPNKSRIKKSGFNTHFFFNLIKSDLGLGIVLFLFSFMLYENMAPSRLSSANFGADGGDFITAVLTKGIPHPTGYPLYLILSNLFQIIPINTPIWKQAQLSIISASLCVSVFYYMLRFLSSFHPSIKYTIPCFLASVFLSISPLFWSQAVIIEVYALNALFICLSLLWISIIFTQPENLLRKRSTVLCIFAWICGLGIGNHTSIFLLYPAILFGLFEFYKKTGSGLAVIFAGAGWFSGIITYVIIPMRAAALPLVSWGDARTINGFFWLISGGNYQGYLFAIQPGEYIQRVLSFSSTLLHEFGIFGILVGLLGVINNQEHRGIHYITMYVFFAYFILASGYKTLDSLVYCIPSIICFTIWIYWGLIYLWNQKRWSINLGILASIMIGISLLSFIPIRYAQVDPRKGELSNYAESSLFNAEPGEVLYPPTDGETFALWYYEYGLGIRQDVVIVSGGLLQYPWYKEQLKRIYPNMGESLIY